MTIDRDKIQIVIEIPSIAYKACLKMKSNDDDELLAFCLINAVANGKIIEQSSVEPEIIRCEDCKYASPDGKCGCKVYHFKQYEVHEMYADDFCSRAERREEE